MFVLITFSFLVLLMDKIDSIDGVGEVECDDGGDDDSTEHIDSDDKADIGHEKGSVSKSDPIVLQLSCLSKSRSL